MSGSLTPLSDIKEKQTQQMQIEIILTCTGRVCVVDVMQKLVKESVRWIKQEKASQTNNK